MASGFLDHWRIETRELTRYQTEILKGLGILLIVLHNVFHNLTPYIGQNEFSFDIGLLRWNILPSLSWSMVFWDFRSTDSRNGLTGCWKSPSLDFFNHGSGKRGFPLPSFSMAYSHRKWRHIHVPHTGRRKTVFFNALLTPGGSTTWQRSPVLPSPLYSLMDSGHSTRDW